MHYKTPDVDGIGNKRLNLIALLKAAIMKYQEEELSLITYGIFCILNVCYDITSRRYFCR